MTHTVNVSPQSSPQCFPPYTVLFVVVDCKCYSKYII